MRGFQLSKVLTCVLLLLALTPYQASAARGQLCSAIFSQPASFGIGHNSHDSYNVQRVEMFQGTLKYWGGREATAERNYQKYGKALLQRLEALDPRYGDLIADPGIVIRLDDFENFAKSSPQKLDAWKMREAFRDHLGTRTVYRGLALTEAEYKEIQFKGLVPRDYMDADAIFDKTIKRYEGSRGRMAGAGSGLKHRQGGLGRVLRERSSEMGDKYLTQSFTDYPELAIGMGLEMLAFNHELNNSWLKDGNPAGRDLSDMKVYVFKAQVQELDLIFFKGPELSYGGFSGESLNTGKVPYYMTVYQTVGPNWQNGLPEEQPVRVWSSLIDRKLESFLFFGVQPEEIKDVSIVETRDMKGFRISASKGHNTARYDNDWLQNHISLHPVKF